MSGLRAVGRGQVLTRRLRLAGDFDFKAVAKRTPGFVGADLRALTTEAAALAVTRAFKSLDEAQALLVCVFSLSFSSSHKEAGKGLGLEERDRAREKGQQTRVLASYWASIYVRLGHTHCHKGTTTLLDRPKTLTHWCSGLKEGGNVRDSGG
jgi:hypothetical protein